MGCVLQQYLRHDEDGTEVEVVADDDRGDGATVHQAERSENHGEAEGDEAETTDGGDDIGAEKYIRKFCTSGQLQHVTYGQYSKT